MQTYFHVRCSYVVRLLVRVDEYMAFLVQRAEWDESLETVASSGRLQVRRGSSPETSLHSLGGCSHVRGLGASTATTNELRTVREVCACCRCLILCSNVACLRPSGNVFVVTYLICWSTGGCECLPMSDGSLLRV